MARGVNEKLSRLRALRKEEPAPGHVEELRKALTDRSNLVVALAAEIAGQRGLALLEPDLAAAFDRLVREPADADKRCLGKIALLEALNTVESERAEVFLSGIRYGQGRPYLEGAHDPTAIVRGNAAFGLVRVNHRDALNLLAELLADPQPAARAAAARALGYSRAPAALPLLRYKACLGDREPAVTVECLTALAVADPKDSLPFIARFLDSEQDAVQEAVAFALGETRRPEALAILLEHWPAVRDATQQRVMLLAISSTRLPKAHDFLIELLASAPQSTASLALASLAIHRLDKPLAARVAATVTTRRDPALDEEYRKSFPQNLATS